MNKTDNKYIYTILLILLITAFFYFDNNSNSITKVNNPNNKSQSLPGLIHASNVDIITDVPNKKLNYYNNNSYIVSIDQPTNVKKSDISDQLEYHMKKDAENTYIDNKVLSGELELKPTHYSTPDNKLDTSFISPNNKLKIKNVAKIILPEKLYNYMCNSPYYNDLPPLKKPDEFYEMKSDCKDKAIRRCKLPPMHSTRCYLNECELSTYNQCTNNVHNQNSCECKANDLCKLPDKVRSRCYKQRYNDCLNKNSINKYR